MPHGVTTFLQVMVSSVIGGGVGAGTMTFGLNFWRGERDLRRANLERLYTAVHKYTKSMLSMALWAGSGFELPEDQSKLVELTAQFDLITVLIDLYFPQLKPAFESFRKKHQKHIGNKEGPFKNAEELKEEFSDLVAKGAKTSSRRSRV
jgi:hypothetical protein